MLVWGVPGVEVGESSDLGERLGGCQRGESRVESVEGMDCGISSFLDSSTYIYIRRGVGCTNHTPPSYLNTP